MRWPWVGRGRWLDAVERAERAEARCDRLEDALVRLARKQNGLSEAPVPKNRSREPLPPDLLAYVAGFAGGPARESAEREVRRALGNGWTPEQILAQLDAEGARP